MQDRAPILSHLQVPVDTLLDATDILRLLRLWAKESKLCNMHTERLLARFRGACRPRSTCDRHLASGYLSLVRYEHLKAGGTCSSKVTRGRLRSMGITFAVTQRSRKLAKFARKAASSSETERMSWPRWSSALISIKQERLGRSLGRAEYCNEIGHLGKRWFSYVRRGVAPPSVEKIERQVKKRIAKHAQPEPYDKAIGNNLFGLFAPFSCIRADVLRDECERVVEAAGAELRNKEVGWSNKFLAEHRNDFISNSYVEDGDL